LCAEVDYSVDLGSKALIEPMHDALDEPAQGLQRLSLCLGVGQQRLQVGGLPRR